MRKKVLSLLLAGVMTASLLAGCTSKTEDAANTGDTANTTNTTEEQAATPSDDASAEQKPVTLKTVSMFGGTDPNAVVYEAINKEFMEANGYITLEDNSQSSDEDWKAAVAADFAVGNEPDVIQFFTDATANTVLATDKFVSLEEIRAEYPDYAKDTLDSALDAVTNPDGVQRAVPTTGYWEGLYCNKDLFDRYDVALPTDWDSLVAAIEVFKDKGIIPIACSLNNVPHYWVEYLMLYAAGGESYGTVPETAPAEWVKGLETFATLRDMGAFPKDTDTVDDAYTGQLFKDKKAAMQLDGSWFAGGIVDTENTVVIAFPGIEGQKAEAGAMVGGISSGFYITKKAWDDPDKRDAAVKFVEAQTCKSAVQRYWEAGGAISKAAVEVEPIDGMTNLALSALEYTNAATSINAPTDSRLGQEPYAVIISNIVKISTGAASAEDVLNESLALYAQRNK
ncbi:ABC transporter substrate-binding protein [Konateibacter massiliensis]|uniref:ABC transporter substrate-binding protein n=1 Tax=Konateibacter massiliensis TaxID=2002841 RepID=UPI000C15238C|nr:extracellular solute-binding protein [Konateibacter massiliensis]